MSNIPIILLWNEISVHAFNCEWGARRIHLDLLVVTGMLQRRWQQVKQATNFLHPWTKSAPLEVHGITSNGRERGTKRAPVYTIDTDYLRN